MVMTVISVATPMVNPSIVREVRSLWLRRALKHWARLSLIASMAAERISPTTLSNLAKGVVREKEQRRGQIRNVVRAGQLPPLPVLPPLPPKYLQILGRNEELAITLQRRETFILSVYTPIGYACGTWRDQGCGRRVRDSRVRGSAIWIDLQLSNPFGACSCEDHKWRAKEYRYLVNRRGTGCGAAEDVKTMLGGARSEGLENECPSRCEPVRTSMRKQSRKRSETRRAEL